MKTTANLEFEKCKLLNLGFESANRLNLKIEETGTLKTQLSELKAQPDKLNQLEQLQTWKADASVSIGRPSLKKSVISAKARNRWKPFAAVMPLSLISRKYCRQ